MHENEILVLLLGFTVYIIIWLFRANLKEIPAFPLVVIAYSATFIGWLATLLEHLIYPFLFNIVEHLGYMFNGLLMLAWICFGLKRRPDKQND